MTMIPVSPIENEQDYEAALARAEEIFHAELGTPEGDELDTLVDFIMAYEDKHYPIGQPQSES